MATVNGTPAVRVAGVSTDSEAAVAGATANDAELALKPATLADSAMLSASYSLMVLEPMPLAKVAEMVQAGAKVAVVLELLQVGSVVFGDGSAPDQVTALLPVKLVAVL